MIKPTGKTIAPIVRIRPGALESTTKLADTRYGESRKLSQAPNTPLLEGDHAFRAGDTGGQEVFFKKYSLCLEPWCGIRRKCESSSE